MDLTVRRQQLLAAMDARGDWPGGAPWVREAITALPRDLFAPDTLWHWDGHRWTPLQRGRDEDAWAGELYGSQDRAAVTQLLDGLPSSSISSQGVVASMLGALRLEPGHRVGEAGTGSGLNTALLARRAGPDTVVSVEVDQHLAEHARHRLARHHAGAAVLTADADPWPGGEAGLDRFIATYAVDRVPWSWITALRPAGRLVFPWGHLGHAALTVADDHRSATGPLIGLAQFMPARARLTTRRTYDELRRTVPEESETEHRLDLAPLRTHPALLLHLRVVLPEVTVTTGVDEDGTSAWAHDGRASWAALSAFGGGQVAFVQGGPRRLADEIHDAVQAWYGLGEPGVGDYGITVLADEQYAWCRDPLTGPRWPQP
ncbi:methyltransferase domain-containing protein [Kitasatospora sp. NPDC006697]|uniref:methyltransferase domain-containing protein n=1 Tax=Kitasatospora sp. NPDC006697 TaxID=3364020 RepID=UPI0036B28B53